MPKQKINKAQKRVAKILETLEVPKDVIKKYKKECVSCDRKNLGSHPTATIIDEKVE